MLKVYQRLAEDAAETIWQNRLDLDRFLPALVKAIADSARKTEECPKDYDDEELNYAANQKREVTLFLEGLGDAIGELSVVEHYGESTTDHIDMGHIRSALAILRNLKRRVDFA